jgi:cytochrome b subunit of formate dehydrogenase
MLHDYIVIIWFSLFYFYPVTLAITGLIIFLVWPKRKQVIIKILLLTLTIFILLVTYNAIERHVLG